VVRTVTFRLSEEPVRLWLLLPPTTQQAKTFDTREFGELRSRNSALPFLQTGYLQDTFFFPQTFSADLLSQLLPTFLVRATMEVQGPRLHSYSCRISTHYFLKLGIAYHPKVLSSQAKIWC
jgi:hypothetical protein